jgi:hypothetical protein
MNQKTYVIIRADHILIAIMLFLFTYGMGNILSFKIPDSFYLVLGLGLGFLIPPVEIRKGDGK